MNDGELKAIIEDFVQLKNAIASKLSSNYEVSAMIQAEYIAGQIIAGKVANNDYKGKGFYSVVPDKEKRNANI